MRKDETVLENGGDCRCAYRAALKAEMGEVTVTKSKPIYWAEYEKKQKTTQGETRDGTKLKPKLGKLNRRGRRGNNPNMSMNITLNSCNKTL